MYPSEPTTSTRHYMKPTIASANKIVLSSPRRSSISNNLQCVTPAQISVNLISSSPRINIASKTRSREAASTFLHDITRHFHTASPFSPMLRYRDSLSVTMAGEHGVMRNVEKGERVTKENIEELENRIHKIEERMEEKIQEEGNRRMEAFERKMEEMMDVRINGEVIKQMEPFTRRIQEMDRKIRALEGNKIQTMLFTSVVVNGVTKFVCPNCDWLGANNSVVKTHMKKKHFVKS